MGGHTFNGVRGLDSVRVAATVTTEKVYRDNEYPSARTMWRAIKGME
jgi:hypothetical protein